MTLELRRIRDVLGVTFLHVTGNEAEALGMGDRMIVLDQGRAIMIAPPAQVFDTPANTRVAQILNAYNILRGEGSNGSFLHAGAPLPLRAGISGAKHYAIRFDASTIVPADDPTALLQADFLTSEFTGSGVTYFLRGPAGVFEVERHLSRADPVQYVGGERVGLTWSADVALAFDVNGDLIANAQLRGAA
jgi:ABC-type Fe3+/spermidine/putrescine transport system ATPase subunit